MARTPKGTSRKSCNRDTYDKILIVTEGEKTEPYYFQEAVDYYKIPSASVTINGECRSAPGHVLSHAKKLVDRERKTGSPYDKVFIVIDKDDHSCFYKTISEIECMSKQGYIAVHSIPCFEFWLILHFKNSTKCYKSTPGNTVGYQAESDLRKFPEMENYQKKQRGIFRKLLPKLSTAIKNEKIVNESAKSIGVDNPTSHVGTLITYLSKIRSDRK